MAGILQSGNVTPGHGAVWVTDGVLADGGALPSAYKVLARLTGADFNDTGDQPLIIPAYVTAFQLTGIIVTNSAVSLTSAIGGFYPQAAKGGTPIVAASQAYSSLDAITKLLSCTLAGAVATTRYSLSNLPDWKIYLSLTTPQGLPAEADVYVVGVDLT